MATNQLSFKKVSEIPASGLETGTIFFNSTTHSLFVVTSATTTEEYGSNIKDVSWKGNVLTIQRYTTAKNASGDTTGSTITLDFSDVASSTDVSKVCAGIVARVGSLETSVSTNTTAISGHESRIAALEGAMGTGEGQTSLASRLTTVEGKVSTLETTVGDSTSGLVKDVSQLKTDVAGKAAKEGNSSQTFSVATPTADSHAATKKYVDDAVTSVYKVKGTKATVSDLPSSGNTAGDVWNVTAASGTKGSADYVPAGTNYVWTGSEWDALGGVFDLTGFATSGDISGVTGRLDALEQKVGSEVVNTFGGQSGTITVKTADSADANGTVQFAMSGKQLTASVKGIAGAAYKGVDTSGVTETATSTNLPTTAAVATALNSLHGTITSEITSNTKMAWANEW